MKNLPIFFHIEKTAGTSLREALNLSKKKSKVLGLYLSNFKIKRVLDKSKNKKVVKISEQHGITEAKKLVENMTSKDKNKFEVIIGHSIFYGLHDFFKKDANYITIFRHPFKRAISHYNYAVDEKSLSPQDDFVDMIKEVSLLNNFMTERLHTFGFLEYIPTPDDRQAFRRCLNKFYFVSEVEKLKEDETLLRKIINLEIPIPKSNTSINHIPLEQIEKAEKIFRQNNELDFILYEEALLYRCKRKKELESIYKNTPLPSKSLFLIIRDIRKKLRKLINNYFKKSKRV